MERFWKAALSVAGIGAIGLFVIWSLYNKWLTLPIFPQLTQEEAFQLLRYFLFLTFAAGIASIAAFVYVNKRSGHFVPNDMFKHRLPDGARFTDEQFDAYKDVWVSLQVLREAGVVLWETATRPNLRHFADCLKDTRRKVAAGGIFFQTSDYVKLQSLLNQFNRFHDGKEELIEYLDQNPGAIQGELSLDPYVAQQIEQNRHAMQEYSTFIDKLRTTYQKRLAKPNEP